MVQAYPRVFVEALERHGLAPSQDDLDQPLKIGRPAVAHGKALSASVRAVRGEAGWFFVTARVCTLPDAERPLTGNVVFILHPTFGEPVQVVRARGGRAELEFASCSAFTFLAIVEDEKLVLELDLSSVPDVPPEFVDH